jgi:hypothetical protein
MTTEAPKKRTRKPKVEAERPKHDLKIDPKIRCSMCGQGKFFMSTGTYIFKGSMQHTITDIPCEECDSCKGKRYQTDDICKPSIYVKQAHVSEVDYKTAMKGYEANKTK